MQTIESVIQEIQHDVSAAVQMIVVADEMVDAAFPPMNGERTEQNRRAFAASCPPIALRGLTPDLYRAHVTEIIERIQLGDDAAPATDAEIIAALSATSLNAPLNRAGQEIYEHLFAKRMPLEMVRQAGIESAAQRPLEAWIEEELIGMRRKLRQEGRGR